MTRKYPPDGTYESLSTGELVDLAEQHTYADTSFHCDPWNECYTDCVDSFRRRLRQALWDEGWTPEDDTVDEENTE